MGVIWKGCVSMSSNLNLKKNKILNGLKHSFRYIVLVFAFLVVGLIKSNQSILAAEVARDESGTTYVSVQSAINNATEYGEVILLADVNECITVSSGLIVTLNLNGHSITCQGAAINNQGDLIIEGNGIISATDYAILNNTNATLVIENGEFNSTGYYGVYNSGTITINSGKISNISSASTATYGVYNLGTAVISVEEISAMTHYGMSYAVSNSGTMTFLNGEANLIGSGGYSNNYSMENSGLLTISGGIINKNKIVSGGLGISAYATTIIGIQDGEVSSISPVIYGGINGTITNFYDGRIYTSATDLGVPNVEVGYVSTSATDENGKYLYLDTPVAVNDLGEIFGTLEGAVSKIDAGTITLLKNVNECIITIEEGENITLVLNANIICATTANSVAQTIVNRGILTIEGAGTISAESENSPAYGIYNSQGTLTINGVTINVMSSSSKAYGIDNYNGTVIVSGGTISAKSESDSIACGIYDSGTLMVSRGTISAKNTTGTAYGIFLTYSSVSTTIGCEDGEVSMISPVIHGRIYGTLTNFYDGRIYSSSAITATNIESGYSISSATDGKGTYYYLASLFAATDGNGTNRSTLQAAIDATTSGTVTLLKDVNECIAVASGKTITLNLNGYIIRCEITDEEVIENRGILTIDDFSSLKEGEIMAFSGNTKAIANDSGQLTINNIAIVSKGTGQVYGVVNQSEMTLNNVKLSATRTGGINTAVRSIYNSGTITIIGGEISASEEDGYWADSSAWAIENYSSGTAIIVGTSISVLSDNSNVKGIQNSGTLTIRSGIISVTSTYTGATIYGISNYGTVTIGIAKNEDGIVSITSPVIYGRISGTLTNFYDGRIYASSEVTATNVESGYVVGSSTDGDGKYWYLISYSDVIVNDDSGKIFNTLQEAITGTTSTNINLHKSVDECITIASGKNITLVLNGNSINCFGSKAITNNGTLTIGDKGTIRTVGSYTTSYGIYNSGTLIFGAATIGIVDSSAIGIYVNSGTVSISSGIIRAIGTSSSGSAKGIELKSGSVTISGGVLQASSEDGDSYGVSSKGAFSMSGGIISSTSEAKAAYGVSSTSGTSSVTGGVINATSGASNAIGVSTYSLATLVVMDADITAMSDLGTALMVYEVGEEITNDTLENDDVNNEESYSIPRLSNDLTNNVVTCEYLSKCVIEELSFVDYKGEKINSVVNTITYNNQKIGSIYSHILGTYVVTSVATDSLGNMSSPVIREYKVVDMTAPVVNISETAIIIKVGEKLNIDISDVKVNDNYDKVLDIELLSEEVNVNKEGTYKIGYKVVDSSGNTTIVYRDVIVKGNSTLLYWIIGIVSVILIIGIPSLIIIKRREY